MTKPGFKSLTDFKPPAAVDITGNFVFITKLKYPSPTIEAGDI